jgi:hypothetical protein
LRFSWLEIDLLEPLEFLVGAPEQALSVVHVELDDIGSRYLTRILHRQFDGGGNVFGAISGINVSLSVGPF